MNVLDEKIKMIGGCIEALPLTEYALFHGYSPVIRGDRLTATQIKLLLKIKSDINQKMSSIARSIGLEKGPFSQLIDKMVDKNLIKRVRSDEDRRVVYLSPTEKGNQYIEEINKMTNERVLKILKPLSEEEKSEFLKSLLTMKKIAYKLIKLNKELYYERI